MNELHYDFKVQYEILLMNFHTVDVQSWAVNDKEEIYPYVVLQLYKC